MVVWGPFDLQLADGQSIKPRIRKRCALLALLALSKGHRQTRKWLQTQLWSESDDERGSNSLRQELSKLRQLIGPAISSDNFDVWLDARYFEFDHLDGAPVDDSVELLQGIDIGEEGFEDWLREQRQEHAKRREARRTSANADTGRMQPASSAIDWAARNQEPKCTIIFDCEAKGGCEANVALMFLSEQLYNKLNQYDFFECLGYGAETGTQPRPKDHKAKSVAIIRVLAFANREEVCLGIQIDSGTIGPRLGYQSVVLPLSMSRLRDAPEIGRLVQTAVTILLDRLRFEALPTGSATESMLLAHEARKHAFSLDEASLGKADLLLTRAYELEARGEYLAWRAFLRNSAFFQHRRTDIFHETLNADELSMIALQQSPDHALVQAFAAQTDYINQGSVVEQLTRTQCAVDLDRSDPLARAFLSNSLTVNGKNDEAIEVAEQSVSLAASSRNAYYFHHFTCMAATAKGDYETALSHARKSVSLMPEFVSPRRYEVALCAHLGDDAGLQRAVAAMQVKEPEFTAKSLLDPAYPVNTMRRLPIIEAIG